MVEDMKGKIRVYCRSRPLSSDELARVGTQSTVKFVNFLTHSTVKFVTFLTPKKFALAILKCENVTIKAGSSLHMLSTKFQNSLFSLTMTSTFVV